MQVKVRLLTKDLLSQAEVFAALVRDDLDFHFFTHHSPGDMLSDEWKVYLMLRDDSIIAWGHIQKFPDNPRKQHVVRLGFVVRPEFRGRSFGGQMMEYVIEFCTGYEKLVATTFADNLVMVGMFMKRGFVIEGYFRDEERSNGFSRDVISLAKHQEVT